MAEIVDEDLLRALQAEHVKVGAYLHTQAGSLESTDALAELVDAFDEVDENA